MKILYYKHLNKWVVRKNSSYLAKCNNLAIYILSDAENAYKFKSEKEAKEAIKNYKKFR